MVEGVDPLNLYLYKGRIDAKDLVHKTIRHDQSTLAIQQVRFFAIHNGRLINDGKSFELDPVEPYPGFEHPIVYDLPEELLNEKGDIQSTTLGGTRPRGRLILYTSRENMHAAYKELRSRWKVTYRTQYQMIGSKLVSELIPQTPGSYFVYATVELSALEPDYVEPGRRRPLPGPLVEAVDVFVAEKMRTLAKEINDSRKHEIDRQALDEVHEENRLLDNFKNRFLPSNGFGGEGGIGEEGTGGERGGRPPRPREYGEAPEIIGLDWDIKNTLRIGRGVNLRLDTLLRPRALDSSGRLVPGVEIEWCSGDRHIAKLGDRDYLQAVGKGFTEIWARIKGMPIQSLKIRIEVWVVDHVLLTPRALEIPVGLRKQIIAEVTNDEGYRATDVFLNWEHDADDRLIVRISPTGWVMGNRIGRTSISAGAGQPDQGGVWARIRAEVNVVTNPDQLERGGGFPELKLTGRDVDPQTGEIREGDPDQPALWQEVSDYKNNIWWLNLESPEAAFFFKQRTGDITVWRAFHAQKVVEMVIQVHMKEEYDAKGDAERPDLWNRHKAVLESFQVLLTQAMWNKLQQYVLTGGIE